MRSSIQQGPGRHCETFTPPEIIVSAVNLVEGGTLSILTDLAAHLERHLDRERIVYLVHKKAAPYFSERRCEIYSWPKKTWVNRIYFEKFFVRSVEKRLRPKLWISLHDVTASLRGTPQIVYCHNPSPFFDGSAALPVLDLRFFLFRRFYSLLYKWGIRRNRCVVVQQQWMREEFVRRYALDRSRVVVAHPVSHETRSPKVTAVARPTYRRASPDRRLQLIYPTFPRVFKNVEYLGELARRLCNLPIDFLVTLDGTENSYARFLLRSYGHLPGFKLVGRQSRAALFELYAKADALIFPSRLETWGLPLSEFMETRKPILAADLPYAREVLNGYPFAALLPLKSVADAEQRLRSLAAGDFSPQRIDIALSQPFCPDWDAFVGLLGNLLTENRKDIRD